jgi:hypothetical protein
VNIAAGPESLAENRAPMQGPNMNANEKAMPTRALEDYTIQLKS